MALKTIWMYNLDIFVRIGITLNFFNEIHISRVFEVAFDEFQDFIICRMDDDCLEIWIGATNGFQDSLNIIYKGDRKLYIQEIGCYRYMVGTSRSPRRSLVHLSIVFEKDL